MLNKSVFFLKALPGPVAKLTKRILVYPRYWNCLLRARKAFKVYGAGYANNVLFIVGMPKSGTTWLAKMLSSYPGYSEILIPEATFSELRTGSGHLFDLPRDTFKRFRNALVLTKMHCHGSAHNIEVLQSCNIPYVVLYRDPRDVAISHYYYVKGTPWHGDYPALKNASLEEGIAFFIDNRLPEFCLWMRSWRDNRDFSQSLLFSYEEMLADTKGILHQIFDLFDLPATDDQLKEIVEKNSFKKMQSSALSGSGFFRKGRAGDWVNHFNAKLKERFNRVDSDILIEFGYERNDNW